MSRQCQLTGRRPGCGTSVSHSHRRTGRRWEPNPHTRRYWLPSEDRYLQPRLSAKAIKTVDRHGIEAVLARLRARGERI